MKTFFYTLFLLLLGIGIGFYFGVNKGAPSDKAPTKAVEEKKETKEDKKTEVSEKETDKAERRQDMLDCADDEDCLENSLNNCTPARFSADGMSSATIKMAEDGENCLFNFNLGDDDLNCEIPLTQVSKTNRALDTGDSEFLNSYCEGSLLKELTGGPYSSSNSGSGARARSTSNIANINNISQALEVYYSDYGQYPDADENNCLDSEAVSGNESAKALAQYLKGNKVPKPYEAELNSVGCIGSYYYKPLARGEVNNNSYVLASDMVTWQMANYKLTASDDDSVFSGSSEKITEGISKLTVETEDPMMSVYVIIP